jgi:hypothetical protein
VWLPDAEVHDHIRTVGEHPLYELDRVVVFDACERGAVQTSSRWVHVDTEDVDEPRLFF